MYLLYVYLLFTFSEDLLSLVPFIVFWLAVLVFPSEISLDPEVSVIYFESR